MDVEVQVYVSICVILFRELKHSQILVSEVGSWNQYSVDTEGQLVWLSFGGIKSYMNFSAAGELATQLLHSRVNCSFSFYFYFTS